MLRRSFLGLMGATPIMARQVAAQAAGLKSVIPVNSEASKFVDGFAANIGASTADPITKSLGSDLAAQLVRYHSPEWEAGIRREHLHQVYQLDADLASTRAFSLSAAIRLQAQRNADKEIAAVRQNWLEMFKRETGLDWVK